MKRKVANDDTIEPIHKVRRSLSSSVSSQDESHEDTVLEEIPGFCPRAQFIIINCLSIFGLKTINSFLNGFSYLTQYHTLQVNPILHSFEKRFLRIIEKINERDISVANRKLFEHLISSGLCTRPFMFKNMMKCVTDIDKVANQLGLPITAKLKCIECDAYKAIKSISILPRRRLTRDAFEKQIKSTVEAKFCFCSSEGGQSRVKVDVKNVINFKMKNTYRRNHQLNEIPKRINLRNQEFQLVFLIGFVGEDLTCVLHKERENSFFKANERVERVSENTEICIKFIAYALCLNDSSSI